MKIAVTSASGQLGSEICKALIKEVGQENVIGLARTPEKAKWLGIEIRPGDYDNAADFLSSLEGIDAVVILSANGDPQKRIPQHRNIIEGAKQNGVKKIVYTSICGSDEGDSFSPVVKSNRQTEEDIKSSGLDWAIGRNGLYLEPDLEYIGKYIEEGGIKNCAGEGLSAYTTREELASAYAKMAIEEKHNGLTYNMVGEPITQFQLAELINKVFNVELNYTPMSVEDYTEERKKALGDFLGTIIGGIYAGIRNGYFNPPSDFEKAAGRPHKSTEEIIREYKAKHNG